MTADRDAAGDDQRRIIRETARAFAPDHYISALLAPGAARDDLITLAAFWAETGRIALTVSESTLAAIRLQWWRDALQPGAAVSGHPVADAMQGVLRRHGVAFNRVEALLDAREQELEPFPFADEVAFEGYVSNADGSLAWLWARVCCGSDEPGGAAFLKAGALACGSVRVALDLPYFAARGRMPLWADMASEQANGFDAEMAAHDGRRAIAALSALARRARAELRGLITGRSRRLIDAVLPVALLEPYLRALENKGHDALHDVATIAPLSRVARLSWAHVRGRI